VVLEVKPVSCLKTSRRKRPGREATMEIRKCEFVLLLPTSLHGFTVACKVMYVVVTSHSINWAHQSHFRLPIRCNN
jgi:hypothetical protein